MKTKLFRRILLKNLKYLKNYCLSGAKTEIPGVSEWLLDNIHLIEQNGCNAAEYFKKIKQLPQENEEIRIYRICRDALDGAALGEKLIKYLSEQPDWLESRELSSIPSMVVYCAIENAVSALKDHNEKLMASSVKSLFALKELNIEEIICRFSVCEKILSKDPVGEYTRMTDETKAYYRDQCAMLAQKAKMSEEEYANLILERARAAKSPAQRHVGYYLIENTEEKRRLKKKGWLFIGTRIFAPFVASSLISWLTGYWWLGWFIYIPLHEILRPIIERLFMIHTKPYFMPRMNIGDAIPPGAETLVTVSNLVPSPQNTREVCAHLEELMKANENGEIKFCLLADLKEAKVPVKPEDETAIESLKREINKLNRKYNNRFVLLVRRRVRVKTQNAYSGWERKRGAITELIRFIKTGEDSFLTLCGDRDFLKKVKYLIVLDSDTELPFHSAGDMVSAAMHPLNLPRIDPVKKVVQEGFGILAPLIATDVESAGKTLFARIMSGAGGVNAYNSLSGNHYQDMFGISIFAGKGLINVDAFFTCLDKALPTERILSHDILEGAYLRCGLLSDVELTDGCPNNAIGFNKRLHRWIRGDFQNVLWLLPDIIVEGQKEKNPIIGLHKIFLSDNVTRSLAPVMCLASIILALFVERLTAVLLLIAVLGICFKELFSCLMTVLTGGVSIFSQKYYSNVLPDAKNQLVRAFFSVVTLVNTALTSLSGAASGLYRQFISKKRLLEWTTAADGDRLSKNTLAYYFSQSAVSVAFGIILIYFFSIPFKIAGALFLFCPFLLYYSGKKSHEDKYIYTENQRELLVSYASSMWKFYDEQCGKNDNFLPPDNVQKSPVFAVAHRTSPTNIGLMLLSTLCVCDMGIIDAEIMTAKLEKSIGSIEKLEKFHGNLLNWYDTRTLKSLEPKYCSTVDSGNFVCCLEALHNGLCEYSGTDHLRARIRKLIDDTDLRIFYNKQRKLFHIGYDLDTGSLTDSYYDLLMSEARMTSFFAVASGQVPKKHWGALGRVLTSYRGFSGPVSWTGTMFEYYMPALLLPTFPDTLTFEALRFCAFCQQQRARRFARPWGCSESGFYAFDNQLNYQYKAHGIQRLGLKRHLNDEYVISPYSSFLTLPHLPAASLKNLETLRNMGMTGRYGFYEAADFTKSRCGNLPFAIVRSYMAHHVGMSICAITNALFDDLLCKRFMSGKMGRAKILLFEKIPNGTGVYKRYVEPEIPEKPGRSISSIEKIDQVSPVTPKAHLLSNGELTLIASDSGLCSCKYRGYEVYRPTADPYTSPQGVIAVLSGGDAKFSLTSAPDYTKSGAPRAEFAPSYCAYYAKGGPIEGGMSVSLHEKLPCEIRTFKIRNRSGKRIQARLTIYFEPCMFSREDSFAHPAFNRLFIESHFSQELSALVFTRRTRDGESPMSLVVGFSDARPFYYDCSRESVLSRPYGTKSLLWEVVSGRNAQGVPDTCCGIEIALALSSHSQKTARLILSSAATEEEAARNFLLCREDPSAPQDGIPSPLFDGSIEGRLGQKLLPCIAFGSKEFKKGKTSGNKFTLYDLWLLGISGDHPLVIYELCNGQETHKTEPYIKLRKLFRNMGIKYDLCLVCENEETFTAAGKYSADGVFVLNKQTLPTESLDSLYCAAVFIAPKDVSELTSKFIPYTPVRLLPSHPVEPTMEQTLAVANGYFSKNSFTVTGTPVLPYSHILCNETFGTMVSDCSLGFTFAGNARENRLTPWSNDSRTDNRGELLIAKIGNRFYDLIAGARAVFSPEKAVYLCEAEGIHFKVTVTVPAKFARKLISVEMLSKTEKQVELAFMTLPTLFFDRRHADKIEYEFTNETLIFRNPFNTAIPGYMGMGCSEKTENICYDLADFLCGRWMFGGKDIKSELCGALTTQCDLRAEKIKRLFFSLCFSETKEETVALSRDFKPQSGEKTSNSIKISTPDPALDLMFNTWLPHQFEAARINARTAFYQSSGAYGFRDQLQDICALLLLKPERARKHILLCCARQFEQGDVLHWWHELKNGPSGIRTHCSDDMLWLPYAVCEFVEKTGDMSLLEESVPFLKADELKEEETDRYFSPPYSETSASVFEHCKRAVERVRFGEKGLPLIGSCDWNDGFSKVGCKGLGESVWLAQFYIIVAEKFASLCMIRSQTDTARVLLDKACELRKIIDEKCYEDDRYVRAFFDDGTPIGSKTSEENKIDLLPQAFSVMCRMPDTDRVSSALDCAMENLVDKENKIIHLFTPAFDKVDAGYIRAYPAGIRENGGQYTHGAVWLAEAFLKAGRIDEGYELLSMMNPAKRCEDPRLAAKYMVEPYTVAADIYDHDNRKGRGGWTHYTGAAGWLYRIILGDLLGIKIRAGKITVEPGLPSSWNSFSANLEYLGTRISIQVERTGTPSGSADIPLDGGKHSLTLQI